MLLSKEGKLKGKKAKNYQEAAVSKSHHILFFKGKTAVWNITDLTFVEKYYLIEDVWCVLLAKWYTGPKEEIANAISQAGLQFFYSTNLKFHDSDITVFRSFIKKQDFWNELVKAKNQEDLFEKMYKKQES